MKNNRVVKIRYKKELVAKKIQEDYKRNGVTTRILHFRRSRRNSFRIKEKKSCTSKGLRRNTVNLYLLKKNKVGLKNNIRK